MPLVRHPVVDSPAAAGDAGARIQSARDQALIPLFSSIFVFDRARAADRHQQRDPRHAWRAISLTRDEARRIAANIAKLPWAKIDGAPNGS